MERVAILYSLGNADKKNPIGVQYRYIFSQISTHGYGGQTIFYFIINNYNCLIKVIRNSRFQILEAGCQSPPLFPH